MKPYMCLLQLDDTVLHKAAMSGHCDVLQLLIDAGMSVDIKGLVSGVMMMMCLLYMYWVSMVHGEVTL